MSDRFNILDHGFEIPDFTPGNLSSDFTIAHPTRAFNAPFLPSATRPTYVVYSAQIPVTSTLTSGQTKTVYLHESISDSGPWVLVAQARMTLNQALGLTVTLVTSPQGIITALIPAGHWLRLTQDGPGDPISVVAATETTL